ncbi:MAG: sporulation protein YabP [Clostridium sp.]|nr:sporulation protein YabP [Clostridium sp.]
MEQCKNSNLALENRKKLSLSGVEEIVSFQDEKISLNTILGNLIIRGSNLKMSKLDVQSGEVIISGVISSMIYSEKNVKVTKESIIKKLFK